MLNIQDQQLGWWRHVPWWAASRFIAHTPVCLQAPHPTGLSTGCQGLKKQLDNGKKLQRILKCRSSAEEAGAMNTWDVGEDARKLSLSLRVASPRATFSPSLWRNDFQPQLCAAQLHFWEAGVGRELPRPPPAPFWPWQGRAGAGCFASSPQHLLPQKGLGVRAASSPLLKSP